MMASRRTKRAAGDGDERRHFLRLVRGFYSQIEQAIFFRAHRVGDVANIAHSIAGTGLTQHRDAAGLIVVFDEIDRAGEFAKPRLNGFGQLCAVCDLYRIVGGEIAQFRHAGPDRRYGGVVFGQKLRRPDQEISPCGTFGAPDIKQQCRDLVFDFDGVNDLAAVIARFVDKEHRRGRNRDKHQKSRSEQDDLPDCSFSHGFRRHEMLLVG